jgi:hypothetical protein
MTTPTPEIEIHPDPIPVRPEEKDAKVQVLEQLKPFGIKESVTDPANERKDGVSPKSGSKILNGCKQFKDAAFKLATFAGPGALISVAYIDPDNYQTSISSGAKFEYKLLFMILISNIIAIYLQVCSTATSNN